MSNQDLLVKDIFSLSSRCYRPIRSRYYSSLSDVMCQRGYFTVDFSHNIVEVPTMCMNYLHLFQREDEEKDILLVPVVSEFCSGYTTADSNMKKLLTQKCGPIVRFQIKHGDTERTYYGTTGTILDADLNPVLMCTWTINLQKLREKVQNPMVTPIMRIRSDCFREKEDQVQKYIVNKLMLAASSCKITDTSGLPSPTSPFTPEIRIGKIPFVLRHTEAPSIDTSAEELRKFVLNDMIENEHRRVLWGMD